jgi:hypothetical protein
MGASDLIELGRKSCGPGKIRRAAYMTRKGVKVPAKCVEDTGKRGKTPLSQRVLPQIQPGFLKGWKHDMPVSKRHQIIQKVTDAEGCASTIRRLNLLANYTENTSPATHSKAREDMAWVRKQSFCDLKSKR